MRLYRTAHGPILETNGVFHLVTDTWDALLNREDLRDYLERLAAGGRGGAESDDPILAPIDSQEVWAAGVTYFRSRAARMEESKDTGGSAIYDRVYEATRPEIFFKAVGWRVSGPGEPVRIRSDCKWSVPEPELALYVNSLGKIVGYTIGDDVSARDLEGENPLYLPQAKIYDGSCALGPAVLVSDEPLPPDTSIALSVHRTGNVAFEGDTTLSQMRRTPTELVEWLYSETSFPRGCVLLTGTGIVPPDDFALRSGDRIRIEIESIGVLVNPVA